MRRQMCSSWVADTLIIMEQKTMTFMRRTMRIGCEETITLKGNVDEIITMAPNSKLILQNAILKGSIIGDSSTTVSTRGRCSLYGTIKCGSLKIGGKTTFLGKKRKPNKIPKVMLGKNELRQGDWLVIESKDRSILKHYIYVGHNKLICREEKGVHLSHVRLYKGLRCWLVFHGGSVVAQRALRRFGEKGYHSIQNNSEHFCSEVAGLGHYSEQVSMNGGNLMIAGGSPLESDVRLHGNVSVMEGNTFQLIEEHVSDQEPSD